MNFAQLEYIIAVDTVKHFAKAADLSFVTQPTLSMMIKKLEQELGGSQLEVYWMSIWKSIGSQSEVNCKSIGIQLEVNNIEINDCNNVWNYCVFGEFWVVDAFRCAVQWNC